MDNEILQKSELKKVRFDQAIRRKKIKKMWWIGGTLLVLIIFVGGGIWLSTKRSRNLPGQVILDQGREHVGPGHTHVYNSNPPTSGPHFAQPVEWGVYKEELPDEALIHNLEHGGIWISYRQNLSEDIRVKLESAYQKWGRKVIVVPRSKNDTDIALAAWNRLDKFSAAEYSEERVDKFIKAFRNKGPEFVP